MANNIDDIKKWLLKSLNTSYGKIGTIENYPKDVNYKKEIPLLIKFAKKALSSDINWFTANKENGTARKFINEFEKFFNTFDKSNIKSENPKVSTTSNYFKNISGKLNEMGIQVGDLANVYDNLTNLIFTAQNPSKFYKSKAPEGFEFFFKKNNDGTLNFQKLKEIADSLKNEKNSNFRNNLFKISDWNSNNISDENTFSSAASSKPIILNRNERISSYNDSQEENSTEEAKTKEETKAKTENKKEEIKTKIENNIQPAEENRRSITPTLLKVFSLDPYTMRENVRKNKNYDFKKEFEEFEKAFNIINGLEDYINQKKKENPGPREEKLENVKKKIGPARKAITEYRNEAKRQYDITHRLGFITDREAGKLADRIFQCLINADKKLLKLGRAIDNANSSTLKEINAKNKEYFIRRKNEIIRNVWEGSRTTRNIRDWFNEKKVIYIIREIRNNFPKEEAEKIEKEFKDAYYNPSPENDRKLAEIKMALSDAQDKKAKGEIKSALNVLKKVKNKVFGDKNAGGPDDMNYSLDAKGNRIYKNKGIFNKIKDKIKPKEFFDKAAGKMGS